MWKIFDFSITANSNACVPTFLNRISFQRQSLSLFLSPPVLWVHDIFHLNGQTFENRVESCQTPIVMIPVFAGFK
jgi:hypothetical protein